MGSDAWQDARMKETAARIRSDVGYRFSWDDLMNARSSVPGQE